MGTYEKKQGQARVSWEWANLRAVFIKAFEEAQATAGSPNDPPPLDDVESLFIKKVKASRRFDELFTGLAKYYSANTYRSRIKENDKPRRNGNASDDAFMKEWLANLEAKVDERAIGKLSSWITPLGKPFGDQSREENLALGGAFLKVGLLMEPGAITRETFDEKSLRKAFLS